MKDGSLQLNLAKATTTLHSSNEKKKREKVTGRYLLHKEILIVNKINMPRDVPAFHCI